ncbi:hypothetical protein M9Y10_000689 [Tritrichomonas musculus]|uniref:HECT-type E3 ubiquitin transferase n=1 Tax=Tritrichomonas musculus TaxID=1915356 RepID=A0ABR2L4X7_9EUKA
MSEENSLLLASSSIFENSNIIDRIRQSFIDLDTNIQNKLAQNNITDFLQEVQTFLNNDIQANVLQELISVISLCFKKYTQISLPFSDQFYAKSRLNTNYAIAFSSIFYQLISSESKNINQDFDSFATYSLKKLLHKTKSSTKIFQHQLLYKFQDEFLINLLVGSNFSKKLFIDLFPFILSQNIYFHSEKFIMFLRTLSLKKYLDIISPTKTSNSEIQAFLANFDLNLMQKMSHESLILIANAILFIVEDGKKDVNGLNEHSIIQFISIVEILLQKTTDSKITLCLPNFKNLLVKAIKSLKKKNWSLLNESIKVIFKLCDGTNNFHITFQDGTNEISFTFIKKFIKKEITPDLTNIYECIFNLTNQSSQTVIKDFLRDNRIFEFVFSHISDINKLFLVHGFDISFVTQSKIIDYITSLKKSEKVIEALLFIRKHCPNFTEIEESEKLSEKLISVLNLKMKENDMSSILGICSFVYIHFSNFFPSIIDFLPKIVLRIIGEDENEESTIDELLEMILLSDYLDEDHSFLFDNLFDLMMKDKEIRSNYLDFLTTISTEEEYRIDDYLNIVFKMYEKYPDDVIDATNRHFYFNENRHVLLRKINYSLASLSVPKLGSYVVNKLYKEIEKNSGNYQALLCLKNIACAFPFLFTENQQKIFDIVLPSFNFISLMYYQEEVENKTNLIKAACSAMSFLFSAFQAPFLLDNFIFWLLPNVLKLTDEQVTCIMLVMRSLYNEGLFHCVIPAYIKKFDLMEIAGILLEREIKNESFRNLYLSSIYSFVRYAFYELAKLKHYEIIQIDDFTRMDFPFNFMYDYIYLCSPNVLVYKINDEFSSFPTITEFLTNITSTHSFYVYNSNVDDSTDSVSLEQINSFMSKLEKTELSNIDDKSFPIQIFDFTIKMVDYIVMQRGFIYCWYLYNYGTTLVPPLYDALIESGNKMIAMQNDAKEHPEDSLNANILTYSIEDFLSPCYSQQILYDNLLKQLIESSRLSKYINDLFLEICKKKTGLSFIFSTISKFLNKNDSVCLSNEAILRIINVLDMASSCDQEMFIELCCDNLLNFVLTPEIRKNKTILESTASLFINFESIPIRVTQLIGFLMIFEDKDYSLIMKLCSKFDKNQINNIYHIILDAFDEEFEKENLEGIFTIIEFYKPIAEEKREVVEALLSHLLSDSQLDDNDFSKYKVILFDSLALAFKDLTTEYSSQIYEILLKNPKLLGHCKFYLNNPEFLSFKIRSVYFRDSQNNRISDDTAIFLRINRENILQSSFNKFKNAKSEILLNTIHVEFINEPVSDMGGARREWFELLIKEFFNQSNHLFTCSEKCHSYQPNPNSSLHPNHLEYIRFAGLIIARAIIEGLSIDVHLTRSFYKQILHQEPSLDDLDDIDEELYKGLDWMLHNDIDQLDQVFAIESNEDEIIPLKENGENIKVDNLNKFEYVSLRSDFIFKKQIQQQLNAFCEGFYSLIPYESIKLFTPNEFDLLLCGVPTIDVEDFKANTVYEHPYSDKSPVIKLFFKVISKWENEDLAKLLKFMTGSSRVPVNGFRGFCEMTKYPLRIESGGDHTLLPQSHTCFNILHLPQYETEEEMNDKLHQAIQFCDSFGME